MLIATYLPRLLFDIEECGLWNDVDTLCATTWVACKLWTNFNRSIIINISCYRTSPVISNEGLCDSGERPLG